MLFFEVIFESRGYEYLKYMDMYPDISNGPLKWIVIYERQRGIAKQSPLCYPSKILLNCLNGVDLAYSLR